MFSLCRQLLLLVLIGLLFSNKFSVCSVLSITVLKTGIDSEQCISCASVAGAIHSVIDQNRITGGSIDAVIRIQASVENYNTGQRIILPQGNWNFQPLITSTNFVGSPILPALQLSLGTNVTASNVTIEHHDRTLGSGACIALAEGSIARLYGASFFNCTAWRGGAVDVVEKSQFFCSGCQFSNCTANGRNDVKDGQIAGGRGGAIYSQGSCTVTQSSIVNCVAQAGFKIEQAAGGVGGAVMIAGGDASFINLSIRNCSALASDVLGSAGGAIFILSGTTFFSEGEISDCMTYSAGLDGARGGCVFAFAGSAFFKNSRMSRCVAYGGRNNPGAGAGIGVSLGSQVMAQNVIIQKCFSEGSQVGNSGGGAAVAVFGEEIEFARDLSPAFINCTFLDNVGGAGQISFGGGGALIVQSAYPVFQGCSFIGSIAQIRSDGPGSNGGAGVLSIAMPIPVDKTHYVQLGFGGTFVDCHFYNNQAMGSNPGNGEGGALIVEQASVMFNRCNFTANIAHSSVSGASASGGAVSFVNKDISAPAQFETIFNQCIFVANKATSAGNNGGTGAAIDIENVNVHVRKCLFLNNICVGKGNDISGYGAAINIIGTAGQGNAPTINISQSIFEGNVASGGTQTPGAGSAIFAADAIAFISDSLFIRNTCTGGANKGVGCGAIQADNDGHIHLLASGEGRCALIDNICESPSSSQESLVGQFYSSAGGSIDVDPNCAIMSSCQYRLPAVAHSCQFCLQNTSCEYKNDKCTNSAIGEQSESTKQRNMQCCTGKLQSCHGHGECKVGAPSQCKCTWFWNEGSNCRSVSAEGKVLVVSLGISFGIAMISACAVCTRRKLLQDRQRLRDDYEMVMRQEKLAAAAGVPLSAMIGPEEVQASSKIGEGASGEVYLGVFKGTVVAVKYLHQHLVLDFDNSKVLSEEQPEHDINVSSSDSVKSLQREAGVMAHLRHPNLCMFMGACFRPGHRPFIVTEYCPQGCLMDILRKYSKADRSNETSASSAGVYDEIPWKIKLKLALGTARGLSFLHAQSPPFIHRDVKSLNVLVDADFNAKVTDFGLLKASVTNMTETIDSTGNSRPNMTTGAGTLRWLPPEAAKAILKREQSSPTTTAQDVWGLGLVIFEIITHDVPFPSVRFDGQVLKLLCEGEIPSLPAEVRESGNRSAPPDLVDIMMDCLQVEQGHRITAHEAAERLDVLYRSYK